MNIDEYLAENSKLVNTELEKYLKKRSDERYIESLLGRAGYTYDTEAINKSILEPSWYLLDLGGKRWRPAIALLTIQALGKNPMDYLEFAIIPEVIHNGTLVHDDIEDNSPMRRSAPAAHIKFGIDVATNLGDFMYFFPIRALIDSKKLDMETKNRIMSTYIANMTRLSIGQATDISWHKGLIDPASITPDKYLQMVHDKTGVLPRFAMEMGAIIAHAPQNVVEALGKFGATVGIVFQIQDDVLAIYESNVSKTKGGVGDDISEGKITLMVIHVLQTGYQEDKNRLIEILGMHTRDKALITEAIAIITKYGSKEYVTELGEKILKQAWDEADKLIPESEAKDILKNLAAFMISRTK
ncbi:MAG: polyprenyl synthetase family protein [Candidatus Micrarchaeota archaeon]|nr:polyprenyl synthetase family protein [Candidatus Micrarchaeota archaeon]